MNQKMLNELSKKKNFNENSSISKIFKNLIQHRFQNLKTFLKKGPFVVQFKKYLKFNK